jgi:hypothetical protein
VQKGIRLTKIEMGARVLRVESAPGFCLPENIAQPLDQIEWTRLTRLWHSPGEEQISWPRSRQPGARAHTHASGSTGFFLSRLVAVVNSEEI